MSTYSERYRTPSPLYPQPTVTSLPRLLDCWERLRSLDTDGYRTSAASPPSTWLVDINWEGRQTHRSTGRGTTCSPFVTQAVAMACSRGDGEPYEPILTDGRRLPFLFSQLANGVLKSGVPAYDRLMQQYGATLADNTWPRPIIFFNLGRAVERTELRRGDCVNIDWLSGGGHAVFVWDVHLNARGEVDAFQYVSANGKMASGGSGGGIAVGGTTDGSGGFIRSDVDAAGVRSYRAAQTPLFVDSDGYVQNGLWVTWDPDVAARPLSGLRCKSPRRPTLVKRVLAARLHGITGDEAPLYAMGQSTAYAGSPPSATRDPAGQVTRPADPSVIAARSDGDRVGVTLPAGDAAQPAASASASAEVDIVRLQTQLHLLSRLEWISQDPGAIDGKLGPRTRRSLASFQRAYGLEESGQPSALSLERLARIYQSALDDPRARLFADEKTGQAPSFADPGVSEDPTAMVHLYFRHGAAHPGQRVALIAHGALPTAPFSLSLCDADSLQTCADVPPLSVDPLGQRAVVHFDVPSRPSGTRLLARGLGLRTAVPLLIVDRGGDRSGLSTLARAPEPSFSSEGAGGAAVDLLPSLDSHRLEQAVAQVLLGQRPLADVAADLGVPRDVLLRWSVRYSDAGRQALATALGTRAIRTDASTSGGTDLGRSFGEPSAGGGAQASRARPPAIAQTLVVSDLHLGTGGVYDCYAGGLELCRMIEREALRQPTRIVCNGDTIDFLLNEDPLVLDRARAVQQAQAVVAHPENAAIFASLGRVLANGGEVVIRMGNHDVELALPDVQDVLRKALQQPAHIARRLLFTQGADPQQTGGLLTIDGARVLITHGEQDDRWNQLDYARLNAALRSDGEEGFEYPPGSRLVKRLLNPLKARHGMRFVDLLKPDFQGAALTALAVSPQAVRAIFTTSTVQLLWQLHSRRGMAKTFADPAADTDADAGADVGADAGLDARVIGKDGAVSSDLGLQDRVRAAGLDIAETQAVQALLQSGGERSFSDDDATHSTNSTDDPEGRSADRLQSAALTKLLRAGLSLYAAGQRRITGREGERYFGLAPDAGEWSEAGRLARKYGAGAVLFGHTHAARFFAESDLVYLNTGTWIWLMQLPPADADAAVWARFLDALRRDPGLKTAASVEDPASPRLLRRLHVARLDVHPQGGARVALCEWLPDQGLVVLRESRVPPSSVTPRLPSVD